MDKPLQQMKKQYALYALIVIVVLAVAFAVMSFMNAPALVQRKQYDTITTGTTQNGDVEVSLTPFLQGDDLIVASTFNTHSVELSEFNLRQAASLKLGAKVLRPSSVFPLTGHHSSGQIVFKGEGLDNTINTFTITIIGIPTIPERVFSWR